MNGRQSWSSNSHAIWYSENIWFIDNDLTNIGENYGALSSLYGSQCPFHLTSAKWEYWSDDVWTSAGNNEIHVSCLSGNCFNMFTHFLVIGKESSLRY